MMCNTARLNTFMKHCKIIKYTILFELCSLDCDVSNATGRVNVEKNVKLCFEWLGRSTGVKPVTFSAICEVPEYHIEVYEYSRLVFENLVRNR